MSWIGTWEGGRVWKDARGRSVYFIRRRIMGKSYCISTRAHTLRAALEHLERFESDPEGYDPTGGALDKLVLDDALVDAFCTWSGGSKGNSSDWVRKQRRYLTWWRERLHGRDLRRVELGRDIMPALDGATARTHRIEVIKALFGWLRQERHVLAATEDPTYGALAVPQGRPEQWRRPKAIPREHHERVLSCIAPAHRDRLLVLAGTGWHVTELHRFAAAGVVAELPATASRDSPVKAIGS